MARRNGIFNVTFTVFSLASIGRSDLEFGDKVRRARAHWWFTLLPRFALGAVMQFVMNSCSALRLYRDSGHHARRHVQRGALPKAAIPAIFRGQEYHEGARQREYDFIGALDF